jgi:hypothetical protein
MSGFPELPGVANTADDIVAVALRHVSQEEAERLTLWSAQRIGCAQALAGDRGRPARHQAFRTGPQWGHGRPKA